MSFECDEIDRQLESMSTLFVNPQTYLHDITSESMVQVVVGDFWLCALIDSGSETCLISESVLKEEKNREKMCEIVGFPEQCFSITKVVHLKVAIGTYVTESVHQFAVISDDVP